MFNRIKSWMVGIYAHLCVLCVLSKSLKKNEDASIDMILTAVVAAIVFAISIAIVYAVLGGIDYTTYDSALTGTPAANASTSLLGNLTTFYNLGPIYIVVIAAVGIIAAVLMVRR
jgi:multisubunit Na+/H+ antiporter MnhB subunit